MHNNIDGNVQKLFDECLGLEVSIPKEFKNAANKVLEFREKQKGVLTVLITGLVYKCL